MLVVHSYLVRLKNVGGKPRKASWIWHLKGTNTAIVKVHMDLTYLVSLLEVFPGCSIMVEASDNGSK